MDNFSTFDQNQPQEKPNNNMILSVIAIIMGCVSPLWIGLLLGIISIVFSIQVNSRFDNQNYTGAIKAAKTAKILALIAIGLAVLNLIWIGINFDEFKASVDEAMKMFNKK